MLARVTPLSSMHRRNEPAAFLTLLVIGLLAAQFTVLAMAVSPPLHKWLHHDADGPDHQCAVTAFSSGQIDFVVPSLVTFLLSAADHVPVGTLVRAERSFFRSSILEHAPPADV
jgi:hypothetical protein